MCVSSSSSAAGAVASSCRSRARSARSVSDCELTDTYSPAAIDSAPATSPATPASRTSLRAAFAAATPTTRLAVETMPSLAPRTAARSQPIRSVRCRSRWRITIARALLAWSARHGVFPAAPAGPHAIRHLVQHRLDRADLAVLDLEDFGDLPGPGYRRTGHDLPSVGERAVPVSYTHLRAHETPEHLVCRLLLEKKKKKKNK